MGYPMSGILLWGYGHTPIFSFTLLLGVRGMRVPHGWLTLFFPLQPYWGIRGMGAILRVGQIKYNILPQNEKIDG